MVSPFNNLQVGSRQQQFTTPSAMTQNQQTGEVFQFTLVTFMIPGVFIFVRCAMCVTLLHKKTNCRLAIIINFIPAHILSLATIWHNSFVVVWNW